MNHRREVCLAKATHNGIAHERSVMLCLIDTYSKGFIARPKVGVEVWKAQRLARNRSS